MFGDTEYVLKWNDVSIPLGGLSENVSKGQMFQCLVPVVELFGKDQKA